MTAPPRRMLNPAKGTSRYRRAGTGGPNDHGAEEPRSAIDAGRAFRTDRPNFSGASPGSARTDPTPPSFALRPGLPPAPK